jgi:hypothetical protein
MSPAWRVRISLMVLGFKKPSVFCKEYKDDAVAEFLGEAQEGGFVRLVVFDDIFKKPVSKRTKIFVKLFGYLLFKRGRFLFELERHVFFDALMAEDKMKLLKPFIIKRKKVKFLISRGFFYVKTKLIKV